MINNPTALIFTQFPAIDSTDRITEHIQQIANMAVWISYNFFAVSVNFFMHFPSCFSKFLKIFTQLNIFAIANKLI